MKTFKKLIALTLTAALSFAALAGCGAKTTQASAAEKVNETKTEATASDAGSETIHITALTGGAPAPFIWTNEDGTFDGYDIKVFEAVLANLPQYDYTIEHAGDIFTSADAGYGQVIVQHLGSNDERREKYLFSYPYYISTGGLLLRSDFDKEINSFEDLAGLTTEGNTGSFNALVYENWNEENPDKQINLVYIEDANSTPLHVADGTIDFEYFTWISLKVQIEEQGLDEVLTLRKLPEGWIPENGEKYKGTYFVFPKDQQEFRDAFDAELLKLIEDGTLAKLAKEYLEDEEAAPTVEIAINNY